MNIKLLTEHYLEFLSLNGGRRGFLSRLPHPHGAVGWSVVYDRGIFWSYSPFAIPDCQLQIQTVVIITTLNASTVIF